MKSAGSIVVTCLTTLPPACRVGLSLRRVRQFLAVAKQCAGYGAWDVGCRITSDIGIRRLNKRYRGLDAPTDILSFAMYTLPGPEQWPAGLEPDDKNLGDMIISAPYVDAWCRERGADPSERYEQLLVHGLTHLLGYDHENEEDYLRMQTREEGILAAARAASPRLCLAAKKPAP